MNKFELLLYLAEKGIIETSTNKLSKETAISQQTISRKLIEMEKNGLIKRDVSAAGLKINITEKGFALLKEKYNLLNKIFKNKIIKGKVKRGIGEGAFYIKKYNKKINKALGFNPYLGTLNIEVNKNSKSTISKQKPIIINSFKTKERTYGSIKCYNAKINNTKASVIIPERTRHPENIVEVISPVYLRGKFNLKDNNIIRVEL